MRINLSGRHDAVLRHFPDNRLAEGRKLVETGQLDTSLETVVINTGHGLKTLDAVSDAVGPVATIDPSYAAFVATGLA